MALRIPPLLQFLICASIGWVASQAFETLSLAWTPIRFVGFGLIGTGVVIGLIAVGVFTRSKTTINPLNPEQTQTLVTTGLYGFSRNPMYLGMLFALIGGACVFANALAFIGPALFIATMTELQIKPEEKVLHDKFGDSYSVYCTQTRRWI